MNFEKCAIMPGFRKSGHIYTTQTDHVMHMQCFRESSRIVEDYFHVVHIKSPEFILEKILQLDKILSLISAHETSEYFHQ